MDSLSTSGAHVSMSSIQHITQPIELPLWPKIPALDEQQGTVESVSLAPSTGPLSIIQAVSIIITLAGVTFVACIGSGILTTALPRIAADIGLAHNLLLWPASVYALASGCTLLAFGSMADAVGPKLMWVGGSGASCLFIMACGLSRTGVQLIIFRALLGLAVAMCLPSSMSLITSSFPAGTKRNIAFAATGMGQPIGYAIGLILGGVFTDTIGWRYGFYMAAVIQLGLSILSYFALPGDEQNGSLASHLRTMGHSIDWLGVALLSACFGILSYVLA